MSARTRHAIRWRGHWTGMAAAAAGLVTVGVLSAQAVRLGDQRRLEEAWANLSRLGSAQPVPFAPEMVEGLPEPARRYFLYTIALGTALRMVAEIEMVGQIGLGDRNNPQYRPMRAREILAPPHGFVWIASVGSGLMSIAGSDAYADGEAWTRFWLLGTVPLVRSNSTPDLVRSAVARGIGEAVFWVPAALLPHNGVTWEPLDENRARAVIDHRGERFAIDLTVAPDGRPLSVVMQRWSNVNPEGRYRWQPFGGTVEQVRTIDGYTVGVRVDGGNHFGTDAYFPFFRAEVRDIRYR